LKNRTSELIIAIIPPFSFFRKERKVQVAQKKLFFSKEKLAKEKTETRFSLLGQRTTFLFF